MITISDLKGYVFTYKTPKYSGGGTIVGVEGNDEGYTIKSGSISIDIKRKDMKSFLNFNKIEDNDRTIQLLRNSKIVQNDSDEDVWKQRWWDMYCFAQKELKMVPIEAADYASHSITKAKEEMEDFFKDK